MNPKTAFKNLLKLTLPYLLVTLLYDTSILFLEEYYGDHIYKVSGQIGSVFGLAVAFFLGFRMNTAYDRWWEGRKIIGELTNNTRAFVAKTMVYFNNKNNIQPQHQAENQQLIQQISNYLLAYIHQFKDQLQGNQDIKKYAAWLDKDSFLLEKKTNPACHILLKITSIIEQSVDRSASLEKNDLMLFMNRFYEIQGKAERINNTPFLLIYKLLTRLMVYSYVILIPLFIGDIDLGGEESGLEFLAVPIMVLISTTFLTIHHLSNLYAAPFSNAPTSLPLEQLINNLQKDTQEMLASNNHLIEVV